MQNMQENIDLFNSLELMRVTKKAILHITKHFVILRSAEQPK